ncbi:A/G-specific adenine glycosylase [Culicoidibacter larvae]|uniref:Adenine DNA glycosylase n=1 Tax=Culicoidibacter larvae TaxID=2579976 RepID=A0A5R8QD77_9FIRM|nr:A/G-specific adenine glycosylase [Culicoidibacter larvae]TLG74240.1 A/G-specific adenine glycosylase [Culicoidibacter larvae]
MNQTFENKVISWYHANKRDLPWRHTTNPYYIWVSEIMLQQTQAERVKAYYKRFIELFPTIADLATAEEAVLLKAWEGLGYYSRVRNLQKAAIQIVELHGGVFPDKFEDVLALTGIGSYTAGAICSIAFGIPKPAVDGNVLRVMTRVLADERDINQLSTKRAIEEEVAEHLSAKDPSGFNQGLIELGATICTPRNPKCEICPIAGECLAKQLDTQSHYPVKIKKVKRQELYFDTVIIQDSVNNYLLSDIHEDTLLQNMWRFPQTESLDDVEALERWIFECYQIKVSLQHVGNAKHVFSHRTWHMQVYYGRIEQAGNKNFYSLDEVPMANAHRNLLTLFE